MWWWATVAWSCDRPYWDRYEAPNHACSETAALLWGDDYSPTDASVDRVLSAFDGARAQQVDAWGFEPPRLTAPSGGYGDGRLLPVYISDSWVDGPHHVGLSYFSSLGYVVLVQDRFLADDDGVENTVGHEHFHAVQDVTGRFAGDDDLWFREGTATWAGAEFAGWSLIPGEAGSYWGNGAHLPLDHPVDIEGDADDAAHGYGTALFWADLDARIPGAVQDLWQGRWPGDRPLEAVARLLEEDGSSFDTFWQEHVGRAAAVDLPQRDDIIDRMGLPGSERWVGMPNDQGWLEAVPLHHTGLFFLQLRSVRLPATVDLVVDEVGSRGSGRKVVAYVATYDSADPDSDTPVDLRPVVIEDGAAEISIEGEATVTLIVAAGVLSDSGDREETFGVRYRGQDTPVEPAGCGCRTRAAERGLPAWTRAWARKR